MNRAYPIHLLYFALMDFCSSEFGVVLIGYVCSRTFEDHLCQTVWADYSQACIDSSFGANNIKKAMFDGLLDLWG